jgi:hypothetical protein
MINKTIVLRLLGGIGNQLFQLQYALNLKKKISADLLIDVSFLTNSYKSHEVIDLGDIIKSYPIKKLNWIDLKLRRTLERTLYKFGVKAPNFINSKFYFENSKNNIQLMPIIILDGFWQDIKHLNLEFVSELRLNLSKKYLKSFDQSIVCVHIRRGDYLTHFNYFSKSQLILTSDYYFKAFNYFKNNISSPTFEIYSDDEIWASDAFSKRNDIQIIRTKHLKPSDLLARMASYHNYIIANSTLSWWAAILSKSKKKKVILPKKWGKNLNSHKYKLSDWVDL